MYSAVPTTDIGLCSFSMDPPARSIVRCATEGAIVLPVLGINDEPTEWATDWGSDDKENV